LCCKEAFLLVEFLREMSRAKKTQGWKNKRRDGEEKGEKEGKGMLHAAARVGPPPVVGILLLAHQVESRESDDRAKRG